MFKEAYLFWIENTRYWIPISEKDKEIADDVIYTKFFSKSYLSCQIPSSFHSHKSIIGFIIYYDQFFRHFKRHCERKNIPCLITEDTIEEYRFKLTEFILDTIDMEMLNEFEMLWTMMPLKHCEDYRTVLDKIYTYTLGSIKSFPLLERCFCDTYKKLYTPLYVKYNVKKSKDVLSLSFDPMDVCEYYTSSITDSGIDMSVPLRLLKESIQTKKVVVSLSGGVDSMITLYLLRSLQVDVSACHIIYGNREESNQEFEIVQEFCTRIGVPLYYYKIEYLRRSEIDRAFYEEMTREIRFSLYKTFKDASIYMGHIQEDVIENVWTNFAKNQHLFDLKKMSTHSIQDGVHIVRPFLSLSKNILLDIAHSVGIPYLKNTTPEWSNRGKFRTRFYEETHIQYGEQVDNSVLKVADTLSHMSHIINKLLYNPVFESYKDGKICVTRAVDAGLDVKGWLSIFEWVCHTKLGVSKPSIHAVTQCVKRMETYTNKPLRFQMKANMQVLFYKEEKEMYLEFLLSNKC
jgi:tRNA(Ile)-lysidine synthetase-like protein